MSTISAGTGTNTAAVITPDTTGTLVFQTNGTTTALTLDASQNALLQPQTTPPTLAINGQLVMNLTSNTNLRISVRGSDGVTRVTNLTLA